jgi:outer membrane protein assembly factor BamB
LHALNVEDGSERWRIDPEISIREGPAAVSEGLVYYIDVLGGLHAVDVETGTEVWQNADLVWSDREAIAVASGLLAMTTDDGLLFGLDAGTGKERWRVDVGFAREAAIANGVVYVGQDGGLTALEAETGAAIWRADTLAGDSSGPVVADSIVYFSVGTTLFAFDAATGSQLWQIEGRSFPVVLGGVAYSHLGYAISPFDEADGLIAFDARSGEPFWQTDHASAALLVVIGDYLYWPTSPNGEPVVVIDANTGEVVGELPVENPTYNGVSGSGGRLFVATWDGTIYCFGSSDDATPTAREGTPAAGT